MWGQGEVLKFQRNPELQNFMQVPLDGASNTTDMLSTNASWFLQGRPLPRTQNKGPGTLESSVHGRETRTENGIIYQFKKGLGDESNVTVRKLIMEGHPSRQPVWTL